MTAYLIRRLLLMIPTLLGITIVVFALIQFVPGGPVEEMIFKVRQMASEAGADADRSISEAEVENIKQYFGFDKPVVVRYFEWLGNVLRLDFGNSYVYQKPVGEVIVSKFPVSITFGVTSFILSYLISIPLGYAKALNHRTTFDTASSILVLAGYVIPGFALGVLLIVFLGGGSFLDWFPISGFTSDNFEYLSPWGKFIDLLHHMTLPLICFIIGQFAVLTLLMKNTLLDELNRDYLRTALTKGLSFRQAAWRHGMRNALIPLVTGIGEIFTLFFTGALLIERVFDLDGMGLLFYNSIVARDYSVVLALIFIISLLTMLGRLFSDLMYVVVDPRIRFE